MSGHGPDTDTFKKAIQGSEAPYKVSDTMAFMFETCHIYHPTSWALNKAKVDQDYWKCWQNFEPLFKG